MVSWRMWVQSLASLNGLGIQHCCKLQPRLHMWLKSGIAVAVVQAGSCSSDLTPHLRRSICHKCGPKKKFFFNASQSSRLTLSPSVLLLKATFVEVRGGEHFCQVLSMQTYMHSFFLGVTLKRNLKVSKLLPFEPSESHTTGCPSKGVSKILRSPLFFSMYNGGLVNIFLIFFLNERSKTGVFV